MGPFEIGIALGAGVLLLMVAVVWVVRLNDFSIRGGAGKRPRFSGRFPEVYRVRMSQFLESEIADERWTIKGAFKDRRFIRLKFSSNMHPFSQQRVRNFLMSLLHP